MRVFVWQGIKFILVGILNTAIDFGALNLLILLTGITGGWAIVPLNTISFLCAATNSYFLNKFWTFKVRGGVVSREFSKFLLISAIGIGINTGIVAAGTSLVYPLFGLSPKIWVNLIKVLATAVSVTWNFVGSKFIVFKDKNV